MAAISFTNIFDIINIPLGFVLRFCYQLTNNYGLAIILFTLIVRLLLVPLAIKQQKTMANTVRLQPKLKALQQKHGKDKQKLNEEQMKLYQEEGANPMGGCLPLLVQLPILYGLYNVIYHPLRYIVQLSEETKNRVIYDLFPVLQSSYSSIFGKMSSASQALSNREVEIYAAKAIPHHMDKLSFLPSHMLMLDFNFFGLDLSVMPGWRFTIYLLIPVLCYVSTFVQVWLSSRINKQNNLAADAPGTGGMNTGMMIIMPLFSAWISFSVPAGVGMYWITGNLIMLAQVILLNKFYNPKELAEIYEKKSLQKKRERIASMREREERLAAKLRENGEDETTSETADMDKSDELEDEKPEEIDVDEKISNKKMMEENRKRLAIAREKEKLEEKLREQNPPHINANPAKKKKKRRR